MPGRCAQVRDKMAKNDDLTTEGGPIAAGFPLRAHGSLSATWENEAARAQARSNGPRFRRQVVIFGQFFQNFVPPHPAKRGGSRSAQPLIRDTPAERAALDFAMARHRRSVPLRRHRRPDFGERLRLAEPGALPRRARPPHGRRLANRPRERRRGIAGGAGHGAAPRPALRPSGTRGRPPGPRPRGGRPRRHS